jgi:hypothetical protein
VLGIFSFNKDVHRLFYRNTLFIIKKVSSYLKDDVNLILFINIEV